MPEPPRTGEKVYRGIPVSGGVSHGPVFVFKPDENRIPHHAITPEQVSGELERLEKALIQTRQQILDVQRQVEEAMGAGSRETLPLVITIEEAHKFLAPSLAGQTIFGPTFATSSRQSS